MESLGPYLEVFVACSLIYGNIWSLSSAYYWGLVYFRLHCLDIFSHYLFFIGTLRINISHFEWFSFWLVAFWAQVFNLHCYCFFFVLCLFCEISLLQIFLFAFHFVHFDFVEVIELFLWVYYWLYFIFRLNIINRVLCEYLVQVFVLIKSGSSIGFFMWEKSGDNWCVVGRAN